MAQKEVLERLLAFLEEDAGSGDITTSSVLTGNEVVEAEVTTKEDGVLSGLEESMMLLRHFGIDYSSKLKDGAKIKTGAVVLRLKGKASDILMLERLLLNMLMRMSGIATATRRMADVCKAYDVTVAATRKTTPGFRLFEKKAVEHGGGAMHRMGLYDAVLIKDNHVAIVGLEESIEKAKKANPSREVEVEVSSVDAAIRACRAGADIVMLDNMGVDEASGVIKELRRARLRDRILVEVSGGVTPENIESYAKLKPNMISSGYLTTNAKWLDMSLKVKPGD